MEETIDDINANEEDLYGILCDIESKELDRHIGRMTNTGEYAFMIQIDMKNIDIRILEMIWELLPNMIQLLTSQVSQWQMTEVKSCSL